MNNGQINHLELLARLPFWEFLSERERKWITDRQVVVCYRAGEHIRGGELDCLGLILIIKGVLRAHLLSPDGREMTLYRIKAGESCVLSASCVLDAVSFETHVEADEDCKVLLIPVDVFSALIKDNIYVECYTYKMAAERFSDVVAGVERLVFQNLEQRIVSFLLDEVLGSDQETVYKTHEQIAVNIGSAREVVSRTLKNMARHGLVELHRGGVTLKDKAALYKMIPE